VLEAVIQAGVEAGEWVQAEAQGGEGDDQAGQDEAYAGAKEDEEAEELLYGYVVHV